ncbi:hypothetical protein MMC18_003230 [Xylographa bjoerkii]|nr:hypothetical protein [Xylographa bjoerkii]
MEETLNQIFSRLSVQSMLCGEQRRFLITLDIPDLAEDRATVPFPTVPEARTCHDYLTKGTLSFVQESYDYASDAHHCVKLERWRAVLQAQHRCWRARFELLMNASASDMSGQEIRGSQILQIISVNATILLSTCMSLEQSSFDSHTKHFSNIVSRASLISEWPYCTNAIVTCLAHSSLPAASLLKPRPSFAFEMGVIPPLYFTALKCRDRIIRRQAISLLSTTLPRKEGLWDARTLAKAARHVMNVEEASMQKFETSTRDTESNHSMPAENKRVHDTQILWEHRNNKWVQRVQLTMRPQGLGSGWIYRIEDVPEQGALSVSAGTSKPECTTNLVCSVIGHAPNDLHTRNISTYQTLQHDQRLTSTI